MFITGSRSAGHISAVYEGELTKRAWIDWVISGIDHLQFLHCSLFLKNQTATQGHHDKKTADI